MSHRCGRRLLPSWLLSSAGCRAVAQDLCVSCEITGVSTTKPVICDCLQTIVFHGRSHFNCATRTKRRLRTDSSGFTTQTAARCERTRSFSCKD
ncbi:hypothetical protein PF011_g27499 [Phytophthora fragariae]|uniref:Secreted protein n=1 Tax=Phytophthora fragariae TaxID=53985 RepID=A0A6A3DQ85_9STRA|nr:hypothetical protein PF009_g29106 [Phytophthora fragariae]KAE8967595.1 hypothetical protein PF011_g27499 [Phytophthora fragariae]